ncbi:unnamed protein product, partial [Brenthis ino]
MDCKILVYFILINSFSEALPTDAGYTDYISSSHEDEYQNKLSKEGEKQKMETSTKPISSYEVTEIVNDIANDRNIGPIHTNFTIQKPLNIASTIKVPVTENDQVTDEEEEKKNCITILRVKAEYDNRKDINSINEEDLVFNKVPHISGIKDYLYGIKKGIVSGFNSIIHRSKSKESVDDDEDTGPLSIFDKLHKKSTDVAHKVSSVIFGEKFDDVFESR